MEPRFCFWGTKQTVLQRGRSLRRRGSAWLRWVHGPAAVCCPAGVPFLSTKCWSCSHQKRCIAPSRCSPSVIGLLVSQILLFLLDHDAPWLFTVVSSHCNAREAHFSVGSVSSRSISSCFMNAALPPATTSLSPSSVWSGEECAWVLLRF